MDKLKEESVFLSNFHVSTVCAPTRACLMTGRYNYRTGVYSVNKSRVNMAPDEFTIAEYLKEVGYVTANFGKWHLGYSYPLRSLDQGFDEQYIWSEMQYDRAKPVIEENGKRVQYYGKFVTDIIFDKAIDWIEKKSTKAEPFFAYIATFLPHTHPDGIQVPDKYIDPFEQYDDLVQHTKEVYAMVSLADENIGRLMKRVNELGLDENTIIIFTSDNGPAKRGPRRGEQLRYNNGFRGVKGTAYEGGIRVPLFFRWPGGKDAGSEVTQFTAHIDVLPTMLDLLGIDPKKDKELDGISFLPLLRQENVHWDRTYFHHTIHPNEDEDYEAHKWKRSAAMVDGYKFVNGEELYHLEKDPYEKHNLAGEKPEVAQQLRDAYETWFEEVTSERGHHKAPNIIGSDKQLEADLYYFEIMPWNNGWPVKVVTQGKYRITVEDVQHDFIEPGAALRITAKDKSWTQQPDRGKKDLVFENVDLPLGEYDLRIQFVGDAFPKEYAYDPICMRYHTREFGYRVTRVKLINEVESETRSAPPAIHLRFYSLPL